MATAVSLLSTHRVPTPIRDMYEIQLHMGFGIDNEYVIEPSWDLDFMATKSTRDLAPHDPSPSWRYLVVVKNPNPFGTW